MSTPTVDYVPEGLNAAGMGSLFVAPTIVTKTLPKITEFATPTGFFIHCDLSAWNLQLDRPTVERSRYCLPQTRKRYGTKSWTLDPISVVYDPQNPDDPNYQAYLKLVDDATFWVFDRRGKASRSALSIGDIGDLIEVTVGGRDRVPITTVDSSELQSRILLAPGEVYQDVAIVAGA